MLLQDLVPGTYQDSNEGVRTLIGGLFEFVSTTFPEFRTLMNSDKVRLNRTKKSKKFQKRVKSDRIAVDVNRQLSQVLSCHRQQFAIVEKIWKRVNKVVFFFISKNELEIKIASFFLSYTTYLSGESIDHLFDDCPDRTNATTAAK